MITEKQVRDYIESKNVIDSMCKKIAIEVAIIRNLIKPGCDERYIAADVSVGNFETTVRLENFYDYDDSHDIKFPTQYLTLPIEEVIEAERKAEQKRIEYDEQKKREILARIQSDKEEKERQLLKELKEKYES
jgi:hypothetical protein